MDFKEELGKKIGPLPTWAWAGIGGVGIFLLYRHLKNSSVASSNASVPQYIGTGDGTGAGGGGGGGPFSFLQPPSSGQPVQQAPPTAPPPTPPPVQYTPPPASFQNPVQVSLPNGDPGYTYYGRGIYSYNGQSLTGDVGQVFIDPTNPAAIAWERQIQAQLQNAFGGVRPPPTGALSLPVH